ncbi:MAG: PaaI family thioesterase [Candidatus Dormibacteraeota bacterium]|nr:PaaI family thioesterase [Candidatus Dormibacteraeota bacterium]
MAPTPEELLALMPFAGLAGVELLEATPAEVRGRLRWSAERCTTGGILHGGALLTLADSLGGVCAYLNLREGQSTATLETKTNFIRAVREGHVEGRARPLHAGRSTIVVETRLVDPADRLISLTLQTQAVIEGGR